MRKIFLITMMCAAVMCASAKKKVKAQLFPDGTPIPAWFADTTKVDVETLGKKYVVTDYGVTMDSTVVQTEKLQAVIDRAVPYDRVIVYLDRRFFERSAPGVGLMDCFDWADQSRQYLLTPDEMQKKALAEAISSYEALIGDRELGAQLLRDSCISRLLVHVNRLSVSASLPRGADSVSDPKIAQALSYINENLGRELTVETLCERVYLSRYHFMRLFKAQTGMTVHAYVRQKRLIQAARLIREGLPASRAAADCGFSDYSAFHRAFREAFGTSPGRLKE